MKEVTGNLWTYPATVRCITTNGFVKKNGECVMGRGCAREARDFFPTLAHELGLLIQLHGNNVHSLGAFEEPISADGYFELFSFPVKHRWNQDADPELIVRSATQLFEAIDKKYQNCVIALPRPGCGNGSLNWEDVRPLLEPILDDRFHVITFK